MSEWTAPSTCRSIELPIGQRGRPMINPPGLSMELDL
jgi:hypothetical protein